MADEHPTTMHSAGADPAHDRMGPVRLALRSIVRRARALLVAERVLLALAVLVGAVLVLGALDFFLRLPQPLRLMHWLVGAGAIGLAFARWIWPAACFNPSLTSVALRVEEQRPELRGLLASGVDFADGRSGASTGEAFTKRLEGKVVDEAVAAWKHEAASGLLRWRPTMRAGAIFGAPLVVCVLLVIVAPHLAGIGALRTLAPWSAASWPKRTAVADVTQSHVHPLGEALPLQAAITRSNRPLERTDVFVRWRPITDGRTGPEQRALMTWQSRDVAVDRVQGQPVEGALFERLVEVDADSIEYRFETGDDRTGWRRVSLVEPPAIVSASAVITPPAYAARLAGSDNAETLTLADEQRLDMGRGLDERATAPPALAGAEVALTLQLNKPAVAEPGDDVWTMRTFGLDVRSTDATLEVGEDRSVWTLRWMLEAPVRIPIALEDEFGIESVEESVFRFQAVDDAPPSVTIMQPETDRAVLPTAVIDLEAEARDDVGLEAIWVTRQRFAPAGGPEPSGPGGAVEPSSAIIEILRVEEDGARTLATSGTLDLAVLGLSPGDELWLEALATDVFATDAGARDASRSPIRKLLIISESAFVEQIRGELAGVRQAAISIDEQQRAVREQAARDGVTPEVRRGQAQVGERIARERQQLRDLADRIESNGLDDEDLTALVDAASEALQQAGQRSNAAAEQLDSAGEEAEARGATPEEALDEDAARQVEDAQRDVEDRLQQVAELLDRGEDAWVLKRRLEGLLEEQRDLQEATESAGEGTTGRTPEELTPDERSELEQIAEKQRELAERTREAIDELREGEQRLRENDPATAQGLSQAARRAEERNTEGLMEQAAQQAEQNRTASAGRAQQQAAEALEEMLEDLEQSQRAREEVLRRLLLSLIDSIDALVNDQQAQLTALLEAAGDEGALDGLDLDMVRLNRNTLGVLDQAKGGGPELASVASLIGRAGEAQTRAIIALRAEPVDVPRADAGERESLDLLIQARDEAERLESEMEERIQDRERRELREAYRAALRAQVDLRSRSVVFPGPDDLSRRDRAQVRAIAEPQAEIRSTLRDLRQQTEEIGQARVFDYAHTRLDAFTGEAQRALEASRAPDAVVNQDRAIAILRGLVEAMEETRRDDEDFRRNESSGGGGGGGQEGDQPLIPDLAELRLLRQMQADLADRTRQLDESAEQSPLDAVEELGAEQADLADLGQELVRRLEEQQGGGPAAPPPNQLPDQPPNQDPADADGDGS